MVEKSCDRAAVRRFAIDSVAEHFSASWQPGEGPPEAYISIAGRQIALDIAILAPQHTGNGVAARLRDDAVARRVLQNLERGLRGDVPEGKTLILTLGAPILEPKKLVAALTEMLVAYLGSGAAEMEEKKTILGNRVRFRVLNGDLRWTAKVVGFVFSGDPKPGLLVNAMRSLHDEIAAKAEKRNPKNSGKERWLVLVSDRWMADIKTYRRAYSNLLLPGDFRKILIVLASGRVEVLA